MERNGATAEAYKTKGNHIITTKIEHHAILHTSEYLEKEGYEVTYLEVDENGSVKLEDLRAAIRPTTILISVMFANNEIGTIQPIEEAGDIIKRKNSNTLFHVDAVQGYGKMEIYPRKWKIDLLSVSGHKIHGPKGVGFLYVNEKVKIKPILLGGGQQKGMRSGTENVPGIAGLAKAAELVYANMECDINKMYCLRDYFISQLDKMEGITVNGATGRKAAPHIVSVSVENVRAEVLLHAMEDKGIYISAGSACSSHKPVPSATLQAIGVSKDLLGSTVRFSFSVFTTREEIDMALNALREMVPMLRKFTRR